MPTYEYRCKDCGVGFDVVQAFTDDALTTCDACGGSLRKVFGSVGIAFKGSGFYKNDSRGKSASKVPAGTTSESSAADSGSSSSGDSGSSDSTSKAEPKKAADAPAANKGTAKKDASSSSAPSKS